MSTILECNGLTKKFGSKVAVSAVNLKIERGQIVGLLGPNGSGKSTILKLANELLNPSSGTILGEYFYHYSSLCCCSQESTDSL